MGNHVQCRIPAAGITVFDLLHQREADSTDPTHCNAQRVVDNRGRGVFGGKDGGVRWDFEAWIWLEDADFF
jgi:hypothetical protein